MDIDPRPGFYYVTMIEGRRVARLAGPYPLHAVAAWYVERSRQMAGRLDPYSHFALFGTARYSEDRGPGILNKYLLTINSDGV